jgi:hypothetical protein
MTEWELTGVCLDTRRMGRRKGPNPYWMAVLRAQTDRGAQVRYVALYPVAFGTRDAALAHALAHQAALVGRQGGDAWLNERARPLPIGAD